MRKCGCTLHLRTDFFLSMPGPAEHFFIIVSFDDETGRHWPANRTRPPHHGHLKCSLSSESLTPRFADTLSLPHGFASAIGPKGCHIAQRALHMPEFVHTCKYPSDDVLWLTANASASCFSGRRSYHASFIQT